MTTLQHALLIITGESYWYTIESCTSARTTALALVIAQGLHYNPHIWAGNTVDKMK